MDAARRAIFSDQARPSVPVSPGAAGWLRARAAVERVIRDRREVRHAIEALVAFAIRTRQEVSGPEAEYALDIRHANEASLRATGDTLVDLLASLANIRVGQWPP